MTATLRIAARAACGFIVAATAWWALHPLERPDLGLTAPSTVSAEDHAQTVDSLLALDDSAFRAPLWVAPPPPPAPPQPIPEPAPLPPLKLQLLAIVRQAESAEYHALLYDPDTDKVIEVWPGQKIGDRTVVGITQRELTLQDGSNTRTLSLRSETDGGAGGGG